MTPRARLCGVILAVTAAVGGLLAAIAVASIPADAESVHLVVWALAALLIARFFFDAINWRYQYIAITPVRFMLTSGLFGRHIAIIPVETLKGMSFKRSLGGFFSGYGAFTVELGGKSRTVIDYIPYPEQIHLEIQDLLYPSRDEGDD